MDRFNRRDQRRHNERNERWGAREAGLQPGDYGFEADSGSQGSGRDGAQGYGAYENEDRRSDPRDERTYGIRAGGNFGVYDIGGQGAKGYHRFANGTYDDMNIPDMEDEEYGARHWGRGEYAGPRRDEGMLKRMSEKVSTTAGKFFGKGPKGYRRSDERIKEDVSEQLFLHPDIDASEIVVEVNEGVITLVGTVDSRRTKRMVEAAVEHLPGVLDVANNLRFGELPPGKSAERSDSQHH